MVHKYWAGCVPQWNKLFSCAANLKTHMINDRSQWAKATQMQREQKNVQHSSFTHSPLWPVWKSFREAGSLKKHMVHHSGENPHSCIEYKKSVSGELRKCWIPLYWGVRHVKWCTFTNSFSFSEQAPQQGVIHVCHPLQ